MAILNANWLITLQKKCVSERCCELYIMFYQFSNNILDNILLTDSFARYEVLPIYAIFLMYLFSTIIDCNCIVIVVTDWQ